MSGSLPGVSMWTLTAPHPGPHAHPGQVTDLFGASVAYPKTPLHRRKPTDTRWVRISKKGPCQLFPLG